jgi:hypothetical protein
VCGQEARKHLQDAVCKHMQRGADLEKKLAEVEKRLKEAQAEVTHRQCIEEKVVGYLRQGICGMPMQCCPPRI